MEFELENPLTTYQDELHSDAFPSLFIVESEHMPSLSYSDSLNSSGGGFDSSFRQEAVSSILQASARFDPFLSYLAVNYFDRFLSSQRFPQPTPSVIKLLAVSCVSLAVKMMNRITEFSLDHIQGSFNNGGLIFDTQTIQRMESVILAALKWRMRSVTPFSFLSYFTDSFSKLKDPPLKQALRARAIEIVLRAQNEVKLVGGFKPSVIAASALLSACHELFPLQFSCFRDSIVSCPFVNKETLGECYGEMQEQSMEEYESVMDRVSSSNATVNAFDRRLSSSSSWSESETEQEEEEGKRGTIDIVSGSTAGCSLSSCSSRNGTAGEVVIRRGETDDEGEIMVMSMMVNGNKAKRRKISVDYRV